METYTFLRELADSWVLVAMFAFLIGTYIWAFWPSQSSAREDASQIPFRNDTVAQSDGADDDLASQDDVKGHSNV